MPMYAYNRFVKMFLQLDGHKEGKQKGNHKDLPPSEFNKLLKTTTKDG
jgi:hypothetical protein